MAKRFCSQCGQPLEENAVFCSGCGVSVSGPQTPRQMCRPRQQASGGVAVEGVGRVVLRGLGGSVFGGIRGAIGGAIIGIALGMIAIYTLPPSLYVWGSSGAVAGAIVGAILSGIRAGRRR